MTDVAEVHEWMVKHFGEHPLFEEVPLAQLVSRAGGGGNWELTGSLLGAHWVCPPRTRTPSWPGWAPPPRRAGRCSVAAARSSRPFSDASRIRRWGEMPEGT